ncbi:MAG TPA: hypothetical protein VNS09_02165 [Solirubrobacter sp.]|nr:hypothetical protein [Solirubrobacter sp.]
MSVHTCGKKRFASGAQARAALRTIRRRENRESDKKPIRAYACDRCHGWHLTSAQR